MTAKSSPKIDFSLRREAIRGKFLFHLLTLGEAKRRRSEASSTENFVIKIDQMDRILFIRRKKDFHQWKITCGHFVNVSLNLMIPAQSSYMHHKILFIGIFSWTEYFSSPTIPLSLITKLRVGACRSIIRPMWRFIYFLLYIPARRKCEIEKVEAKCKRLRVMLHIASVILCPESWFFFLFFNCLIW